MTRQTVLGTGMKFPPQINPATGRFITVSDADNVKESIYLILMTTKSERFMRPEFGSRVVGYTFGDTNPTMLTIMSREIADDIKNSEPRITDLNVRMEPDNNKGCLFVYIDYTLADTQTRDNMVFPFYLRNDTEEENIETMEQF